MFSAMNDEATDLIDLMAIQIGMIMEDSAPIALAIRRRHGADRQAALQILGTASDQIAALCKAIHAMQAGVGWT
ncbi:MAG: hypothetical protein KGJ57_20305 [Sphingomonadales bacterium]|nr:hypothetical protein [Sphingomonadales bacterium]